MESDNDHVFGNSIESSEENTELKIPDNGKKTECEFSYDTRIDEQNKENDGNMSGHYSFELKIDPENDDIKNNLDSLEVFYMNNNITACELPEIVVSNYKELTYSIVKDICVDEDVPMMQEKFLFNETDSIKVIANYFESKSSEDNKFEECVGIQDSQENLTVTGKEVKDDSEAYHEVACEKPPPRDVVDTSRGVSKGALTLGDIISMEDCRKLPKYNNISGNEENVVRETEQEKTEEPKADNLRYLASEIGAEPENQRLNDVLEDSYDHNLFTSNSPNGFGERSICEAESSLAHITYTGPISVSGSLSFLSDGSTVSASSFAFAILQSEWKSSPVRLVKAEKRQLRKKRGWRHYSFLLCCRF